MLENTVWRMENRNDSQKAELFGREEFIPKRSITSNIKKAYSSKPSTGLETDTSKNNA